MPTDTAIKITGQRNASRLVAASDADVYNRLRADYLCDGTADNTQIQAAIDALPAGGGSVMLTEGTYTLAAGLSIPASVTLEGQGFGTILNFGGASSTYGFSLAGSNACLKNLKAVILAGAGSAGARPNVVSAQSGQYNIIEHLWLIGDKTVGDDASLSRQNGIILRATNSKIINCIIENNMQCGIHIQTGIRNDISGNLCKDNTKDGIFLRIASVGNVLVHNICESNDLYGIHCWDLTKMNTITANRCYDNYHGIALFSSTKQVVSSNICTDSGQGGIYVDSSSTDNQISANQCSDNGRGIQVYADRNSIVGNICVDNNWCGIFLYRASYCAVTGNAVYDTTSGDGILVTGDGTTNADYNTLTGNACTSNGGDGIEIAGGANANKNIVLGNQLTGNSGTALVDGGTLTNVAHNITA